MFRGPSQSNFDPNAPCPYVTSRDGRTCFVPTTELYLNPICLVNRKRLKKRTTPKPKNEKIQSGYHDLPQVSAQATLATVNELIIELLDNENDSDVDRVSSKVEQKQTKTSKRPRASTQEEINENLPDNTPQIEKLDSLLHRTDEDFELDMSQEDDDDHNVVDDIIHAEQLSGALRRKVRKREKGQPRQACQQAFFYDTYIRKKILTYVRNYTSVIVFTLVSTEVRFRSFYLSKFRDESFLYFG